MGGRMGFEPFFRPGKPVKKCPLLVGHFKNVVIDFSPPRAGLSIEHHRLDNVITSYSIHYTKLYDFYAPTVINNVAQNCEIVQKEVFGPVVTIQSFKEESEA